MPDTHIIQVGTLGRIGRYRALDPIRYRRRSRVVVRTERGLELGQVLLCDDGNNSPHGFDGDIIRTMTIEDDLLAARLEKNRQEAFQACSRWLEDNSVAATLVDVEQLFDGNGIYFYFLGDTDQHLEQILHDLAEQYDATARMTQFAETLQNGCGPDCGTEGAEGGCGDCSGCQVAALCKTG